jgi:beta-N-acetylhexosaminidase
MRLPHVFPSLPLFAAFICLVFSCEKSANAVSGGDVHAGNVIVDTETDPAEDGGLAARRVAEALDDRQLAAQVIISGIDGRGQLSQDMITLLTECPAGGIMLFRYNLIADTDTIRDMVAYSAALVASGASVELPPVESPSIEKGETDGKKEVTGILPFVAVDHEGGAINRFRPGVADLPPAYSYWETAQNKGRNVAVTQIAADSYYAGRTIGGLGVNLNFAPVAEYLNQNNSVFLQDRAYGPDPAFAADAAGAFIAGMDLAGVLCAVKHFPGSAGDDPHLFSSVLPGDREAVAELAAPFESLARDGRVRAIMVSHSLVSSRDSVNVASLSPAVMGGWLRQEWGFEGLIICDDFSMAAAGGASAGRPETLAVQSLAAGADMVLVWPPDLRRTHREIQAALNDGRLSRERLREAAVRIILEKMKMGLIIK